MWPVIVQCEMRDIRSFVQRLIFNPSKPRGAVFEALIEFVKPNKNGTKYVFALLKTSRIRLHFKHARSQPHVLTYRHTKGIEIIDFLRHIHN